MFSIAQDNQDCRTPAPRTAGYIGASAIPGRTSRPAALAICSYREYKGQESHRLVDAAAVRQLAGPPGLLHRGEDLANRRHGVEIEKRITIRLGPAHFQREASVGGDLVGHKHSP